MIRRLLAISRGIDEHELVFTFSLLVVRLACGSPCANILSVFEVAKASWRIFQEIFTVRKDGRVGRSSNAL